MKKLPLRSVGSEGPKSLAPAESGRGGAFVSSDTVLFASSSSEALELVSSRGGPPRPATRFEDSKTVRDHRWPAPLPGGRRALFTIWSDRRFDVAIVDLRTGSIDGLVENASFPRYAASGHLVFAREGKLFAAAFDPAAGRLLSPPKALLDRVAYDPRTGAAFYDFSRGGDLYYVQELKTLDGERAGAFLVNEQGEAERPLGFSRPGLQVPRLSPDGRILIATASGEENSDLRALDLERSIETRLTFEGDNAAAVFSPDGHRIAFASDRDGGFSIYSVRADGSGKVERWTEARHPQFPTSFSPDGTLLAYTELHPETGLDVHVLSIEDGASRPFLESAHEEAGAVFSPDGRYLAYTSGESGKEAVYVRRYPGPEGRWRVSAGPATEPVWSRDGRKLYFRSGHAMMATDIGRGPEIEPGPARVLFEAAFDDAGALQVNYDVGPGDVGFVMIRSEKEGTASSIHVVLNWFEELKERVPIP